MLTTAALAFVAGFFAGNGIPYYVAGSTGEGVNPSPFRNSPTVNVLLGAAMVAVGGAAWWLADVDDHGRLPYAAGLAGAVAVGLIHARVWRHDPWHSAAPAGRRAG